MKLLLTSAGVRNSSIRNALVDLIGKPIAEATALCIPTAMYGHPQAGLDRAWEFARFFKLAHLRPEGPSAFSTSN